MNDFIKSILNEVYTYYTEDILNENKESKMRSSARKYTKSKGYSDEQAKILDALILHDIPNSRLGNFKFFLGITRLMLDGELNDGQSIMKLNQYLKLITNPAHINEYNSNLNGLSFSEIDNRFNTIQQQYNQEEAEKSNTRTYTENQDYQIVRIPDAETSRKYGDYTSWCVTHDESMYDTYTSGGIGLFYFCLKNGFENIPKQPGENCPLDEYGLSMIAVSVNEDGSPNTITCRWNHDYGGNDNVMTTEQLEQIIGRGFYKTFLPRTPEELKAKMVEYTQYMYEDFKHEFAMDGFNTVNLEPLFDIEDYMVKNYDDEDTYYDDEYSDAIADKPFSYMDDEGGYSDEKYIIVSGNGELLCDRWFYDVYKQISNNSAVVVRLNNPSQDIPQLNLYDYNAKKILLQTNFTEFVKDICGIAVKFNNGEWNIINNNIEFVFNKNVKHIGGKPNMYSIVNRGQMRLFDYNTIFYFIQKPNDLYNIAIVQNGKECGQLFDDDVVECYKDSISKFIYVTNKNNELYVYDSRTMKPIYDRPIKRLKSNETLHYKTQNADGSISYETLNVYSFYTMDGDVIYYSTTKKQLVQPPNNNTVIAENVNRIIKKYINKRK